MRCIPPLQLLFCLVGITIIILEHALSLLIWLDAINIFTMTFLLKDSQWWNGLPTDENFTIVSNDSCSFLFLCNLFNHLSNLHLFYLCPCICFVSMC